MISPVGCSECHEKGRRCMCEKSSSRMLLTKPSEPLARHRRWPKIARPLSTAKTATEQAAQMSARAGSERRASMGSRELMMLGSCGSSAPSTESTVTRTICGIMALNIWLNRENNRPSANAHSTGRRKRQMSLVLSLPESLPSFIYPPKAKKRAPAGNRGTLRKSRKRNYSTVRDTQNATARRKMRMN